MTHAERHFTRKERDWETGLDYFGARYFSGAQGRFTSPDAPFAGRIAMVLTIRATKPEKQRKSRRCSPHPGLRTQ